MEVKIKQGEEMIELNRIYNEDCLEGMKRISDNSVDCILTDIPYGEVNRSSNGLRKLDKSHADIVLFDIERLCKEFTRISKGSIYVFCGIEQVSDIRKTFVQQGLSTRIIVWEKTNPSPMNGDKIWLSGIELCVYGKKPRATYNGFGRNSVIRYSSGESKIHPTQKPVNLFGDLILTSSNEGDTIFDPFMGSGTTGIAAIRTNRKFIGFELSKQYFDIATKRIKEEIQQKKLF